MTNLVPLDSEYGVCPCTGTFESILVQVSMTVGDEQVQLDGVSQGRCRRCGSRVYKAAVLEELESLLRGEEPPTRSAAPTA
jgi:hypothetical protein